MIREITILIFMTLICVSTGCMQTTMYNSFGGTPQTVTVNDVFCSKTNCHLASAEFCYMDTDQGVFELGGYSSTAKSHAIARQIKVGGSYKIDVNYQEYQCLDEIMDVAYFPEGYK